MSESKSNKVNVLLLTQFAVLLAIEIIFCFTPLGSLPIGPIVATLAGVPVVMCAVLLGTKAGALLGLMAGIFSLFIWTFMPPQPPLAFLYSPFYSLGEINGNFWSLVISIFPRVMIGVTAGFFFNLLNKINLPTKKIRFASYIISGALGSLANTFFTLGLIYFVFAEDFVRVTGGDITHAKTIVLGVIGGLVLSNGVPEAIICAVAALFICQPLRLILKKDAANRTT
ncbi:MAG: ECF transporter S component [Clostridiales bacterium]|jgi:uncharacterized membrane protein|nr:ECF transporter S component [Clostridiales bacterium]